MFKTTIDGMHLSLTGPESLPLNRVLRSSPTYDGPLLFFTVAITNTSDHPKTIPFDEVRLNVIKIYRDPRTHKETIDRRTSPPRENFLLKNVPAGETKMFKVVFEYPQQLIKMGKKGAVVVFCVRWKKEWLRSGLVKKIDWNESFELCRQIKITL